MTLKLTKNPEKSMVGMVVTGPRNTPVSTDIPAPIRSPRLCATKEVRMHINTNMPKWKSRLKKLKFS